MIDTHVHLNSDPLEKDWRGAVARAEAAGVGRQIVIGFDQVSSEKAVGRAEEDPRVFAVVGIHPHDAALWNDEIAGRLREWAGNPRVVGIGEIGLDYYTGTHGERKLAPASVQAATFSAQLAIAAEMGLPVVIHCRDAYDDCLNQLEAEAGETPVILHCFAGDRSQAERAWKRGWYLGVGGTVTYKKNTELQEIVRATPQERLLLETDAPYLSPEPLRGKFPNESARLPLIAASIATLRGESVSEVAAYTTTNAERVFTRLRATVS